MRFGFFPCLSLLAVFLAVTPRSAARGKETGFLDRALSLHGTNYKYQVFVPENWSAKQKWPIILFLHGAGERGCDGLLQTDIGLPHAIRQDRSRFPTVVVIPQCLKDHRWTEPRMEEMALASLTTATKEFRGDARRTYLTGLSMGEKEVGISPPVIRVNSRPLFPSAAASFPRTKPEHNHATTIHLISKSPRKSARHRCGFSMAARTRSSPSASRVTWLKP